MDTARTDMLTIDDVVRESRLSRAGIYNAMQRGDLVARKYGRRTLFSRADFDAFLAAMPQRATRPGIARREAA